MNANWCKDWKGNAIHEGDPVKISLPPYARSEYQSANGRVAYVSHLRPGMPYTAKLTTKDKELKSILGPVLNNFPVNCLEVID